MILFDEPLSNLDANLRERMRTELQLLQARLAFTAIFVTHDQEEAMSLSDHIVIMNKGLVEQAGAPQDIFRKSATAFAARFLGYSNVFSGHVAAIGDAGTVQVDLGDGLRLSARWRSAQPPRNDQDCTIAFRADRVALRAAQDGAIGTGLPGEIAAAASRHLHRLHHQGRHAAGAGRGIGRSSVRPRRARQPVGRAGSLSRVRHGSGYLKRDRNRIDGNVSARHAIR